MQFYLIHASLIMPNHLIFDFLIQEVTHKFLVHIESNQKTPYKLKQILEKIFSFFLITLIFYQACVKTIVFF